MQGIVERQKSLFFRKTNFNNFFKAKFVHEMSALGQVLN